MYASSFVPCLTTPDILARRSRRAACKEYLSQVSQRCGSERKSQVAIKMTSKSVLVILVLLPLWRKLWTG